MKRYIIKIDEDKCTGCGNCLHTCVSQALQIIDGKSKLVSDTYCDGFGTCIKQCPFKAMRLELREASPYSEAHVMENISKSGPEAIQEHLCHLDELNQKKYYDEAMLYLEEKSFTNKNYQTKAEYDYNRAETTQTIIRETLNENDTNYETSCKWPIRLDVLFPDSPSLENADLVIAADCTPFVYKNFHKKFLDKNQVLIILCPKSENTLGTYVGKLSYIFEQKNISSVSVVRMESQCCDEIEKIVRQALQRVQLTMFIKEYTISLAGEIV